MFKTMEIDRKAQIFFQDNLPPAWLVRDQKPDFHIDYFVELFDTSGPSGIVFGVQSKGTNSPDYSNGIIKITMKTKHLAYYLDKAKQPVFIVVVDVKNKIGYYLFIQEYLINLSEINWRNLKTKVIKLQTDNLLSNMNEFKKAIINADTYMRDLWPSSISASINHEKQRLENLDPRFNISIQYKDGHTKYGLHAKEKVDIKCSIKITKELKKGIINFNKCGSPFEIKTADILNVEGSKIITEALQKSQPGKVIIGPATQLDSSIILSTLNELCIETSMLYNINGVITGGKREFRFQGQLNESPFKVSMTGTINKKRRSLASNFIIDFDFTKWEGLSVLHLPFFEKIYVFFKALNNKDIIKMLCEINGMHFIESTSEEFDYRKIQPMYCHLNLIQKARIIAKDMGANFIMPKTDSISKNDIDNIELIYELITKGECHRNGSNTKISAKMAPNETGYSFFRENYNKDISETIMIEGQEGKYNIFGKEVNLGYLRFILTNSKLLLDSILKDDKYIRGNNIDVRIIGTKNSELIISKINAN